MEQAHKKNMKKFAIPKRIKLQYADTDLAIDIYSQIMHMYTTSLLRLLKKKFV